ncbi:MAG: WGxxGxxG family protein [Acidimicrobiales bacterium]|nr:WGxxGxxG family protein [Acidimicrobiales bacterium]
MKKLLMSLLLALGLVVAVPGVTHAQDEGGTQSAQQSESEDDDSGKLGLIGLAGLLGLAGLARRDRRDDYRGDRTTTRGGVDR